ncbi:hypothetical protein Q7P37_007403 [Cladosporium fusiforme]
MPPKQGAPSSRPIAGKKREQIPVACDACRRRKTKCSGRRPVCSECESHRIDCQYAHEPGEAPFPALKRKFEALQSQSADEHDLLGLLRSSSDHDAIQVLAHLRSESVSSALRVARALPQSSHNAELTPAAEAPSRDGSSSALRVARALPQSSHNAELTPAAEAPSRDGSSSALRVARASPQSSHNAELTPAAEAPSRGGSSSEAATVYPDPSEAAVGTTWALPIDPYPQTDPLAYSSTSGHSSENISRRKMLRKMQSVPNIRTAQTPMLTSIRDRSPKRPVSKSDPRLDRVKTAHWGINFLNDADFRKIITSYLVWDHTAWGVFNTDDFCNALAGEPSDLSSRLLVFAVLTSAARLYVYFDPKLSMVQHKAWQETLRLWQESIDRDDGSIATACAGAIICTIYAVNGSDKVGREALMRAQRILMKRGLYDPRMTDEVYGDMDTWKARTRSQIAWGMLDYVTYVEFTTKSKLWLLPRPPVPVPLYKKRTDVWSPWPLVHPSIQAHTSDLALERARLNVLTREIDLLREKHQPAGVTEIYFNEAIDLYNKFLNWANSLGPNLQATEYATQQLIVLHSVWYHFAVLELLRPFIATAESNTKDKPKFATTSAESASSTTAQKLRQLLVRCEALYGGLPSHTLLTTPLIAVAFEAMPNSAPTSADYSPSSHMAFLTAIRALVSMKRSIPVLSLAILAIQQAAVRSCVSLPPEASRYFKEVADVINKNKADSDWIVDLSRSAADVKSARLNHLVAEMKGLSVHDRVEK